MKTLPIKEFLQVPGNTQSMVSSLMGITQGAVSQAVQNGRLIFIEIDRAGLPVSYYELKKPKKAS